MLTIISRLDTIAGKHWLSKSAILPQGIEQL